MEDGARLLFVAVGAGGAFSLVQLPQLSYGVPEEGLELDALHQPKGSPDPAFCEAAGKPPAARKVHRRTNRPWSPKIRLK